MKFNRALLLGFLLVIVSFGFAVWLYPHAPSRMPTHWDMAGHVDDYSEKSFALFLSPAIAALTWLLCLILPAIAPKGYRLDQFIDVFGIIQLAIIGVLLFFQIVIQLKGIGAPLPLNNLLVLGVGMLMLVVGNYMGKLRKNFFVGVRTPWTLANDEVWGRTHRLAGWALVIAGLALMADGTMGANPIFLTVVVLGAVLLPIVYSFFLYKRLEGFGPSNSA